MDFSLPPLTPSTIKRVLRDRGKKQGNLAKALGLNDSGISEMLKGGRRIQADEVPKIVKFLELHMIPIMGWVGAGAAIDPEFEQVPPEGLETVEIDLPVTLEMIGFEVDGDSMLPRYRSGDVVVVFKEPRRPAESYVGEEIVVRTLDGKRYLKFLSKGGRRNTFTLESHNASDIPNVRIAWIGEIYVPLRAGRVIRRAVPIIGSARRASGGR